MKFVILSNSPIPGYGGIKGPVMTPREYDLHQVLRWVVAGVDIREVMEDGSYRKLQFNDERIIEAIGKELDNKRAQKQKDEKEVKPVEKKEEPKKTVVPRVKERAEKIKKETKPVFEVDDLEPME